MTALTTSVAAAGIFTVGALLAVWAAVGAPPLPRGASRRTLTAATQPFRARSTRAQQNLRLAGVHEATFAIQRFAGLAGGVTAGVVGVEVLGLGGVLYVLAIMFTALVGWIAPGLGTASTAKKRRVEMNEVVRIWAMLVVQQVRSGKDPARAMLDASAAGTRVSWRLLRRFLLAAHQDQRSLWEGLERLAAAYGVESLTAITAATALASEQGVPLGDAVTSVSEAAWAEGTARKREQAGRRDQLAILPATLVAVSLALFVIYPPFVSLTSALTGGGA